MMGDSCFTNEIKIHSGQAVQLGCVALLDTDSPTTFIKTHALENKKHVGAASANATPH